MDNFKFKTDDNREGWFEPSNATKDGLFVNVSFSVAHIARPEVERLHKWLGEFLEETEVKYPTTRGSIIKNDLGTYVLVDLSTYVLVGKTDAVSWGRGESIWLRTDGKAWFDHTSDVGEHPFEVLYEAPGPEVDDGPLEW